MFHYLKSNQEPKVEVVDVSRKIYPEEHLLPNPDTHEPEVVVTQEVDVDAIIQAGAPLCLDLNKLMEQDPEAAQVLATPWEAGDEVIDQGAAANLKTSINSIREANAQAKAAGFDDVEAYVNDLVAKAIEKQKAANEAAEKGENK